VQGRKRATHWRESSPMGKKRACSTEISQQAIDRGETGAYSSFRGRETVGKKGVVTVVQRKAHKLQSAKGGENLRRTSSTRVERKRTDAWSAVARGKNSGS